MNQLAMQKLSHILGITSTDLTKYKINEVQCILKKKKNPAGLLVCKVFVDKVHLRYRRHVDFDRFGATLLC